MQIFRDFPIRRKLMLIMMLSTIVALGAVCMAVGIYAGLRKWFSLASDVQVRNGGLLPYAGIAVLVLMGTIGVNWILSASLGNLLSDPILHLVQTVQAAAKEQGFSLPQVSKSKEVELPSAKKTADDEIAARAVKMLEWDVVVPPGRIAVTVDHGIVTLAGQVDWKYQRDEVEADVWKLTGVKDVVNAVKVRPRPQSADVQERIRKALERSADVEASHISVSVKDGKAVLTGTVGAWIERQTAEGAAWAAPGVTAVEDRIQIGRP